MHIGYLGPLEVRDGARVVEVPGRRLRALLARLAVDVGRPVPVGALSAAVWAGAEPADPVNALQSLVSRLRRTLGAGVTVAQVPGGYVLRADPADVDGERFARLVERGHDELAAGSPAAAQDTLAAALACWRGEPLADDTSADALATRARLAALRERAEVDRLAAALELGRATEVLAGVEVLLARHPLREDLVLLRLRALVHLGRPADALAAYEATRRELADTLGADPSPRLRAVHAELLDPAATGPAATNLRAPVTSFVGREADAARVGALLRAGRLVTVVGTGGAGKTRLATEVARGLVGEVPGGVWFVELAPVADGEGVALAVLDGLGVREVALLEQRADRPRASARERVLGLLAARECLLVLDNCEHVVDAAADLVAEVLGRCPGVRVLATSREPLGVDGEALVPLAPLVVPGADAAALDAPAVRLLLDRAAAAGAVLELDAPTLAAVVEVVRRLDGLPLAIELAAARLRVLPVAEVAARLSDRFRLLTGGRRTAVARHRTLRAVVAWSWELLAEDERAVAERFAVFGAGAGVAAVAAVCGLPDEAAAEDVLTALVDKSLLVVERRGGATRFRMLETLREYGLERLTEAGAVAAVRRAHAAHFAALAAREDARLRTPDQLAALAALDAEREDLLAALGFAAADGDAAGALGLAVHLAWYWVLRESGRDAERWLRTAVAVPGAAGAGLRTVAEALLALQAEPGGTGPAERAARLRRAADVLAGPLDLDPADPAAQLVPLLPPVLRFFADRPGEAARGLAELARHPDRWVRAASRAVRSSVAENGGDLAQVRRDVDVVLPEWEALGDHWGLAGAHAQRAQLRTADGDLAGAEADLLAAREHLRLLGSGGEDLRVTAQLADLRLRAGDVAAARELATRLDADPRARTPGLPEAVLADVLATSVALAADEEGLPDPGLDAVRVRLLGSLDAADTPSSFRARGSALAHAGLARLAVRAGDLAGAREHLRAAHGLAAGTGDLPIVAVVGVSTAVLAAALGRPGAAAAALGLAARLRGTPDAGERTIARLTRDLVDAGVDVAAAQDGAAGLDRGEAVRAVDPDVLLGAAVLLG